MRQIQLTVASEHDREEDKVEKTDLCCVPVRYSVPSAVQLKKSTFTDLNPLKYNMTNAATRVPTVIYFRELSFCLSVGCIFFFFLYLSVCLFGFHYNPENDFTFFLKQSLLKLLNPP